MGVNVDEVFTDGMRRDMYSLIIRLYTLDERFGVTDGCRWIVAGCCWCVVTCCLCVAVWDGKDGEVVLWDVVYGFKCV